MDNKKLTFLENLKKSGGIICTACENTGINRGTFYNWKRADAEFAQAADDVMEMQVDFVESKLMTLIQEGDTTATIFYLKTKGKKRGYSEKIQLSSEPVPEAGHVQTLPATGCAGGESGKAQPAVIRKIKSKKDHIVRLLKKQGKYTAELSAQVTIAARLLVRADMLADEIFSDGHRTVNVEYSREGNERESINPKERLFLDISQQGQKALQALGMNTDARERKSDNDGFSDFMKTFKEDGEQ